LFSPPIPPITDPDLIEAVSALTRAAHSYHSVLFLVAEDIGDEVFNHLLKHEDLLNLSDAIINAWRQQLGHDNRRRRGWTIGRLTP
jgi:hypothetical protein